jgi:flagellar biosynthesis protein FliP
MKVEFEVEKKQALALAIFFKRATFDDAYRRAHGETEEAQKDMAYTMLNAFSKIEHGLEKSLVKNQSEKKQAQVGRKY